MNKLTLANTALPVLLLAGLVAAGCGSSDSPATPGTPSGTAVNGCDPNTAVDHTADANVDIAFPTSKYAPSCVRIKKGSSVTWTGDFEVHPLTPGTVSAAGAKEDTNNPIPETKTGSSKV